MKSYCRHYNCQCDAASELAYMAGPTRREDLLVKAVEIHKKNLSVRCRHVPRDGRTAFADNPRT